MQVLPPAGCLNSHYVYYIQVRQLYQHINLIVIILIPDKQQDIDLPSLQVDEGAEARAKKKDKPRHAGPATTMSQVSSVTTR